MSVTGIRDSQLHFPHPLVQVQPCSNLVLGPAASPGNSFLAASQISETAILRVRLSYVCFTNLSGYSDAP